MNHFPSLKTIVKKKSHDSTIYIMIIINSGNKGNQCQEALTLEVYHNDN